MNPDDAAPPAASPKLPRGSASASSFEEGFAPTLGDPSEAGAAPVCNGPAAAAVLGAGIGCFALGVFSLVGDAFPAAAQFFTFWQPTGPLSGVTTSAIVVWLVAWFILARCWEAKAVALGKVNAVAFALLASSLLLTFPPFMDLLQGK